MKKNIVIFDLDGTLALIDHRKHFVECEKEKQDWNAFYEACDMDEPNPEIVRLFKIFSDDDNIELAILSGRSEQVRLKTLDWLTLNLDRGRQWLDEILRMRPEGSFMPDDVLKRRWASELGLERIAMVFDDRDKVVKMWRELGLTCLQVAAGDF